jgi:hypothetical protein
MFLRLLGVSKDEADLHAVNNRMITAIRGRKGFIGLV